MVEYYIELDFLPPSLNSMYRFANKRMFKLKSVTEFENKVYTLIKDLIPFKGPVELTICFYTSDKRKHDIDNLLKALFDALTYFAFEDDDQVVHVDMWKVRAEKSKTCIIVKEVQANFSAKINRTISRYAHYEG
jgi:Holliday junction resolvase RusA-like endonuclease